MATATEEPTIDGIIKFKPGTLVRIFLPNNMLIDAGAGTSEINLDSWLRPEPFIKEYGPTPIVMVVAIDVLENCYLISLGEKNYWFPIKFTSSISEEHAG